ncbi:MAG: hypothetical protein GYA24_07255 [Candidatus Lokiarchaeota archaeon]|nr:hypothetical protein [Candidatus Lokiarchaeota archaeon]
MSYDDGRSVAVAADGSVYITGSTQSSGAGAGDAFLAKYSSTGTLLWNRTWGLTGDSGYEVAVAADGSVYMAGCTQNFGAGAGDAFLAKYSSTGTQLWNRTWGGTNWDYGYGVAVATDGLVYLAGITNSFGAGLTDAFIAKYDAAGTLLWTRTWGTDYDDGGYGVAVATDGSVYLAGFTYNYGAGGINAFLSKYDSTGKMLWNRVWRGVNAEIGYSVAVATDWLVYLAGITNSFGAGFDDAFLAKYSSTGTQLWNHTWGGTNPDRGNGVAVATDGSVYLAGITNSFGASGANVFLAKYSAASIPNLAITSPADVTYTMGQVGNQVAWTIMGGTTGPRIHVIYRNGTAVTNNTWASGVPVLCSLDGLPAGSYNYTIVATDGTGGRVADIVAVRVIANVPPSISRPADITCTFGQTGVAISWTITDTSTGTRGYTVYRNGTSVASGTWTSGVAISQGVAGLAIGTHNVTIIATDGFSGSVSDTVIVTVFNVAPSITRPADITCVAGQIGNVISWIATDSSASICTYLIRRNGTVVASGMWTSGVVITVNVDGLVPGSHDFTITVQDGVGGSSDDMVLVSVMNPVPAISHPADLAFVSGQRGNNVSWTITDASTGTCTYIVYRNGTSIASGTWTSGTAVVLNVDGLLLGTYNFTIIAADGLGASARDFVLVTVVPNAPPAVSCHIDIDALIISWWIADINMGSTHYTIYLDNGVIGNGTWTNGQAVNASLAELTTGTHALKIVVDDGLGETVDATALIVIVASNHKHDDPQVPAGPDPVLIIVIVFACGGLVIPSSWAVKRRTAIKAKNVSPAARTPVDPRPSPPWEPPSNVDPATTIPLPASGPALGTDETCSRCGNQAGAGLATGHCCYFCGEPLTPPRKSVG